MGVGAICFLQRPAPTCNFPLRKGFLSEGVPITIRGIAGPGAPHLFEFHRRESLSSLVLHAVATKEQKDPAGLGCFFWIKQFVQD